MPCRDTLILDFVLHEITDIPEANLHRLFPKTSLEYFSFCCCKYFLLLSFFIFLNAFCKYSVYIRKFCSVKTSVSYVMAAITRRRVGRPKLPGSLKSIRLRESVFNLWRDRQEALGYYNRKVLKTKANDPVASRMKLGL